MRARTFAVAPVMTRPAVLAISDPPCKGGLEGLLLVVAKEPCPAPRSNRWQCHRVLPPDPLVESERDSAVVLWHFSVSFWCSHRDSNPDFCVESAAA